MPEAGQVSDGVADGRADLPRYDDLPLAGRGGRGAWGLFGAADSVGLLNLQTGARALGKDRAMVRHRVLHQHGAGSEDPDDVLDNFFPQTSSQWDSLAHVAYSAGVFHNGDYVPIGPRNTIDHWTRRGIAGRDVLLDLDRALNGSGRPYSPDGAAAFSLADLEHARMRAGVDFSPGCIVLLRTGFPGWSRGLPRPPAVSSS